MNVLELDNVSKRFGGVQALQDVTLEVAAGAVVGFMGANGAGKTTLFALVAGNEGPSSGDIRLHGRSIVGLRPHQICRRGVARTFQIVRPFAGLTVMENVAIAAMFGAGQAASRAEAETAAREAIHELGLADLADVPAGALTLSGQKRLEIARAVATGATLILLDEVMAGLTPAEIEELAGTLQSMQRSRGLTLLVIEHVARVLSRLCDEIVVLHLGRVIARDSPARIASDPAVVRAYFGADA